MAPALNEPLNQGQLPLSPESASSSPRPGILPSNGTNGISIEKSHHHHHHPHHQQFNGEATGGSSSTTAINNGNGIDNGTAKSSQPSSFQLAFIQQLSDCAAVAGTNGPAASGPSSNAPRHMDRKDLPATTRTAPEAAAAASPANGKPPAVKAQQLPIVSNYQHAFANIDVPTAAASPESVSAECLIDGLDEKDVQELTDLSLHLDEETTNALIEHHHAMCNSANAQQSAAADAAGFVDALGSDDLDGADDSSGPNNALDSKDSTAADIDEMLDLDLMQVFKTLVPSAGDNLCELANGLELFNDVDVISMGLDEVPPPVKETDTADMRAEIRRRQSQMQRKCDFLLRRLRKLQTRSMAEHVDDEVQGLFDHTQKLLQRRERSMSTLKSIVVVDEAQPPEAMFSADEPRGDLDALLRRLDAAADEQQQKMPSADKTPASGSSHQRKHAKDTVSPMLGFGAVPSAPVVGLVPAFDADYSKRLALAAGHLHTEMKLVGSALDSDATASSSGGESGDECGTYNRQQPQSTPQQQQLQQTPQPLQQLQSPATVAANASSSSIGKDLPVIAKRAAIRWARDRATIASRWSWLLAQVSDLEYRIRQHSDLHHQIKHNKGAVTFVDGLANVAPSDQLLAQLPPPDASIAGYGGLLPGHNTTVKHRTATAETGVDCSKAEMDAIQSAADIAAAVSAAVSAAASASAAESVAVAGNGALAAAVASGACRTRAFQRSEFRKRKLLQTSNLHTISKKAAKHSTVKCGCQWPLFPCALCTGRADPTAPRDLPDMLSASERVGLVDPGYHPVISFANDTSQCIQIMTGMRKVEFQTKCSRASLKSVMRSSLALQKALKKDDRTNRKLFSAGNGSFSSLGSGSGGQSPAARADKRKNNSMTNKLKRKSKNSPSSAAGLPAGGGGSGNNSYHHSGANHYQPARNANGSYASSKYAKKPHCDASGQIASQQHHSENFEYGPNGAMLPRSKNTSPTHGHRAGGTFYASASIGRRGAYDIDDIVIPYSVAASTRVEILQCKEIPTPKWRTLDGDEPDDKSPPMANDSPTAEKPTADANAKDVKPAVVAKEQLPVGLPTAATDEQLAEDVTPDAILRRHENALTEERKKFATYLKFPWSTRSRANRRIDSRAESSGTNTPDPTSPALPKTPHSAVASGDSELAASPALKAHPPTTSAGGTALDLIAEQPDSMKPETPSAITGPPNGSGSGRRRTVSTKRTNSGGDYTTSSTFADARDFVAPYEQRDFPLSDEAFEKLLQQMPSAHHELIDKAIQQHQLQLQQQQQHNHLPPPFASGVDAPANMDLIQRFYPPLASPLPRYKFPCDFDEHSVPGCIAPISGIVGNPYGYGLAGPRESDEETESIESGMLDEDEDPNDPEWFEPSGL